MTSPADLVEAVAAARREAVSAFGDGTVFLERFLERSRHVEVQVFGDAHGNVVHLFERECSVQRRHQKVVEESPSPGATDATRSAMFAAAVSLAREIGYVGAGTVEFLVSGEGAEQEFFFLEMNTRLQVEHPVTEAVTGLDLVEWQLAVAAGEQLPLPQEGIRRTGHAIEVRLYAEDPARGYLPNTGVLQSFASDSTSHVRVDSAVEDGSEVSSYYDPMLAKVIGRGPTRELAAARLSQHLRGMAIHGLTTNRDSLVAVLGEPDFLSGATTTDYLDTHPEVLAPTLPEEVRDRHLLAAVVACAALESGDAEALAPTGWRNVPATRQWRAYVDRADPTGPTWGVAYRRTRDGLVAGVAEGATDPFAAELRELTRPEAHVRSTGRTGCGGTVVVDAGVDGLHAVHRVAVYGDLVCVDDGRWSSALDCSPRFRDASHDAGDRGPSTPVPGTVTMVLVAAGDHVVAGQTLVVLEAMKMEHRIAADTDGVVAEVLVDVGTAVDAHQVVVLLEEES